MIIPYQVDVPAKRWPFANLAILAVMLGTFLWRYRVAPGVLEPFVLTGWSPSSLLGHMWLHVDVLHLVGNMVFLWTFGNAVCAKIGNLFYAFLYVGLGVLAGAAHVWFGGGPAVGASGAINGIIGVYLVLYPVNRITCVYFFWILYIIRAGQFAVRGLWLILAWLAFDIFGLVMGSGGVAYWAHIGGFAAGVLLATFLVLVRILRAESYERSLLHVLGMMEAPRAA